MLFLGVAHFKVGSESRHGALERSFSDHLQQPLNPRIRLAGALHNEAGVPCGLFLLMEATSIETVRAFVADSPYTKAELYDRLEINPVQIEIGSV
jgi:uncharacterized protein YciI